MDTEDGRTERQTLIQAASAGDDETVRRLLEAGADPDAITFYSTALTSASHQGHTDVVRRLLDHGASRDGVDGRDTPLRSAAWGCAPGVVRLLLERGARPTMDDVDSARWSANGGRSHREPRAECVETLTLLREALDLPGVDPTLIPTDEVRAAAAAAEKFVQAAVDGDREQVAALLRAGVPVEARNDLNRQALDSAVMGNQPEVVKLLLAAGADTARPTGHYREELPLGYAAMLGYLRVARLLIEAGADLDPRRDRLAPLLLAAAHGHVEVARLLLDAGAPLGGRRRTALGLAAKFGRAAVVRLLLERGVTPTFADLDAATRAERLSRSSPEVLTNFNESPAELAETVALLAAALAGTEREPEPPPSTAPEASAEGVVRGQLGGAHLFGGGLMGGSGSGVRRG